MTKPIQIKNLTIGAGIPKICVPLTGTSREKICQEAEEAKKAAADLVEWRADFFEELMNPEACQNVLEALAEILGETPLLFTIRTSEEGGNITISLEDYAACNINIAKGKKADLVDVEVMSNSEEKKKLVAELQKEGVKVIASSHDFHKTDSQEVLLNRFREKGETGMSHNNRFDCAQWQSCHVCPLCSHSIFYEKPHIVLLFLLLLWIYVFVPPVVPHLLQPAKKAAVFHGRRLLHMLHLLLLLL